MVAGPEAQLAQLGLEIGAVTAPHPQYPAGYKNAEKKLDSLLDLFIRFRLCTFNNTMLPIYKSNTLTESVWKTKENDAAEIAGCMM